MYIDVEIQMYQVTKNLFNVRIRYFDEAGTLLRTAEYDRVAWGTAMGLARAKFLSTRASQGAKEARKHHIDGDVPEQLNLDL